MSLETSGQLKKLRRPRKQPLISIDRKDLEYSRRNSSQMLFSTISQPQSAKICIYSELSRDFFKFLEKADENIEDEEECRRFTIFGDSITCAFWRKEGLISGSDIIKVIKAIYRLKFLGQSPKDRRKFEDGIISDLRSLRIGKDATLEEANSPLLKFLYRLNCVRTHKRQKIFKWASVPFMKLFSDSLKRDCNNTTSPPKVHPGIKIRLDNALLSPNSWSSPKRSDPSELSHLNVSAPGLDVMAEAACYFGR